MLTRILNQKLNRKSFRFTSSQSHFKLLIIGCLIFMGVSTTFGIGKTQEFEFTNEHPNRIIDHYTITQFCDPENPNLVVPTRIDGSTDNLKWTWEGSGQTGFGTYYPQAEQPLDLNYYPDGIRKVYITDNNLGVTVTMLFAVYGSKEQYKGRNSCENEPDIMVWMNTINESIYDDTNKLFQIPTKYDIQVTEKNSEKWAQIIMNYMIENRNKYE
jgi:hypothetical protein